MQSVTQRYRNQESVPIEVVYSFPLPLAATLLDVRARFGERELVAEAVEKNVAEGRYEDAIAEGHRAILVQRTTDNLYTLNLGNLRPTEEAEISFRYALLLEWDGACLPVRLPATYAPRYGDYQRDMNLEPHQVPLACIDADYPLDLEILVAGWPQAKISSPSHSIEVRDEESEEGPARRVRFGRAEKLDRDFSLNVMPDAPPAARAWRAIDGGPAVTLVRLVPQVAAQEPGGRRVNLVWTAPDPCKVTPYSKPEQRCVLPSTACAQKTAST